MALVKDYDLYNRLSRVLNNTFGTTGPGTARVSTQKVNLLVKNENVVDVKYQSIVNFTSDRNLDSLMHKFRAEGVEMIKATLKRAVENYEQEFPGKSLSFDLKMDTSTDNVEFLDINMYRPTRHAFFRLSCLAGVTEKNG